MARYVGKRIVPKHCGVWDRTRSYEMDCIVYEQATGDSYISRKEVPAGTALSQEEYWALCARFSEQMALLRSDLQADVKGMHDSLEETEAAVNRKTDSAVSTMTQRTQAAENLTNTNKSELNARMDSMETRLNANVTAHTTPSGDFAAEVVDARVDEANYTHPSLGDAMLSLGRVRGLQNILKGWTWTSDKVVNEEGVLANANNWSCAQMIPVTGSRILISGKFSKMSAKDEYNNIVCFDRNRKLLGGCFRSEDGNVRYDGQEITLPSGTAYISVSNTTSLKNQMEIFLPADGRPGKVLNSYATAWQWMNGQVEITFTSSEASVSFLRNCYLCRRANGDEYSQDLLVETDSVILPFETKGWWALYYQRPEGETPEGEAPQVIHAENITSDWGWLFTRDRFVLAVFYDNSVVYAAPSNYGTKINGTDYGNPAKVAHTVEGYAGHLGQTLFLEYGQLEIDEEARTLRVSQKILATCSTKQFVWIEASEEPVRWPESGELEAKHMMILGYDERVKQLNIYDNAAFQALGVSGYYVAAWYQKKLWYPHMSPGLSVILNGETVPAGSLFASEQYDSYIEKRYRDEIEKTRRSAESYGTHTMYLASGAFTIDQDAGTMQITERILGVPDNVHYIWVQPQDEPVPMVANTPLEGDSMPMRILGYDHATGAVNLYERDTFRALGYNGYYVASWYQNRLWYPHIDPTVKITFNGTVYNAGDLFKTNDEAFVGKPVLNYVAEAVQSGIVRDSLGDIVTPSHWDCMEGRQFSMFYDCLSRYEGRENLYRVTNGKSLTRNEFCLNYTPAAADTDFSVNVIRLNAETMETAEQKSVKVRVHHKLKKTLAKNICICGDSLVDNNHVATEIFRLLADDGDCTVTQVGTRGPSGGKHEGRGSWKWATYLQGENYADKSNAFWDREKGRLDFQKYCRDHNFSGIDYFLIALGTNDVSQGGTLYNKEADVAKFIGQAKQFVDALLNPETGYPNCRIGIGLCGPGADYSYLAGNSMGIFRKSINTLNLALIKAFDEGAYRPNVTCFAHGLRTNRRLAFPYEDKPVTERYTETSRTLTNSIHPSQRGYQAWADGYYCQIRAWLEEDAGK